MKILLDTHILIWILQDDERLPSKARNVLTNSETELFLQQCKYLGSTNKAYQKI